MSDRTPTKSLESSSSLTPICFSPGYTSKTAASDSNVAACKARLEVIVKTTLEHYHKWQLAQKRGLQLCTNIEAIKTKVLEQMNATTLPEDFTLYPSSMKQYCNNLDTLASICEDIAVKTKESLRQVRALSKLPGSCNEVFYRSWQLPQFIELFEELTERYDKEAQAKKAVSETLPHCNTKVDLILWTSVWEYPQYVDIYVQLLFLLFKEELNCKNA